MNFLGAVSVTNSAAKPNAICGGGGGINTAISGAAPATKTVCCKITESKYKSIYSSIFHLT